MTPDDLINKALKGGNNLLADENTYIVEANPTTKRLRIRPALLGYVDNYLKFAFGKKGRFICLGVFNSEQAATEFVEHIEGYLRRKDADMFDMFDDF